MAFVEETTIVEQGVVDRRVLIILDGVVELFVDGKSIGHGGRGTLIGDIDPDSNRVPATAVAATQVRTVQLPSLVMKSLAERSSTVSYWLERDSQAKRDHHIS